MVYQCALCQGSMDSEDEEVMYFSPCEHSYHGRQVHSVCLLRALVARHVVVTCPVIPQGFKPKRNDPMWS